MAHDVSVDVIFKAPDELRGCKLLATSCKQAEHGELLAACSLKPMKVQHHYDDNKKPLA